MVKTSYIVSRLDLDGPRSNSRHCVSVSRLDLNSARSKAQRLDVKSTGSKLQNYVSVTRLDVHRAWSTPQILCIYTPSFMHETLRVTERIVLAKIPIQVLMKHACIVFKIKTETMRRL